MKNVSVKWRKKVEGCT